VRGPGLVAVGGTGIYFESPVEWGDDVQVAPGSVIVASGRRATWSTGSRQRPQWSKRP